jgi:hypothetical protein
MEVGRQGSSGGPPRRRCQARHGEGTRPLPDRHEGGRIGTRESRDRFDRAPGPRDRSGRRTVRTPDVVALVAPDLVRLGKAAVAVSVSEADGSCRARALCGGLAQAALVPSAQVVVDPRRTRGGGSRLGVAVPPMVGGAKAPEEARHATSANQLLRAFRTGAPDCKSRPDRKGYHRSGSRSPAIDGQDGAGSAPHRPGSSTSGTEVLMSLKTARQAKPRGGYTHAFVEHDF